jgi:hypothetical protein
MKVERMLFSRARVVCLSLLVFACGSEDEPRAGKEGDTCAPADGASSCEASLTCDPLADGTAYVCGIPATISGLVKDSLTAEPIAGARIVALGAEGSPAGEVGRSDAAGEYSIAVSAPRNPDGSIAEEAKWTLVVSAQRYQPFPAGARPAVPIFGDQSDAEHVIRAANTDVALLPLANPAQYAGQISGSISAATPGGTLVVAEGGTGPAPHAIAGRSGDFTLFNVPRGSFELAGYKQGQELARRSVDVNDGAVSGVVLEAADVALGRVSGNVNIVNAPGGSLTSVVLVPDSVFDVTLERGPIPFGLRAPGAPEAPSVSGQFSFEQVPHGQYKVLAAFENDDLVRDPDSSIGGTSIQTVSVGAGESVSMSESFKITEHLAIFAPGAESPEPVSGNVVFRWADDSSEDRYELELYTALGDLVWEERAVPGVSGNSAVELAYTGPALVPGMFYQFRVTSFRDRSGRSTAISRSEDLRGVFEYR